jgi:hypothetical protein
MPQSCYRLDAAASYYGSISPEPIATKQRYAVIVHDFRRAYRVAVLDECRRTHVLIENMPDPEAATYSFRRVEVSCGHLKPNQKDTLVSRANGEFIPDMIHGDHGCYRMQFLRL